MLQALRRDLDGGCRTEAWDLVAQVLEGRAGAHLAAGRLPQALALRLLVLQVRRPQGRCRGVSGPWFCFV